MMNKKLLLLLILLSILVISAGEIYLPMVQNHTPKERFVIIRVDCSYIIAAWYNPSISLRKTNFAGYAIIDQYPWGVPWEYSDVHYWYTYKNGDTEIVYYYAYHPFKPGFLYFLDFNVLGANGGRYWVSNGDQLWLPCKPHKE